jgi:hypothetical protein
MSIKATFSNGFTDQYKGKRAVKAAWMVTSRATGEVLASGHSLTRENAEKTADGHASTVRESGDDFHITVVRRGIAATARNAMDKAKEHNSALREKARARCLIEVIDL